jgi:hypothetical protein
VRPADREDQREHDQQQHGGDLDEDEALQHHVHDRRERQDDPIATRMPIAIQRGHPRRTDRSSNDAELVAQPGHRFAKYVISAKNRPQCLPYRLKPVRAVSPVASVYRSISMFRNHWMITPTSAPQRKTRPTWEEM